jgi:hypothetical protein
VPQEWPLTGRAEELSRIGGLTRRRDGPAGVVLAGAPGVGKTRLVREALAAAEQRGALTRWAVATASARALPLGAFAATLGVVGSDPARLVRQASAALLAGAGKGGVIVGVDDAHLLDELSAMLVHQLVLRRAATLVLTLRTGETAPDAVTALWKDGHLPRLDLQPLSAAETAILLEATLGGSVDIFAARRLFTITRGNVLYLRQLVDGELEAARLHQVAGVWRWSGELALSPGLVELVSARVGQLPDEQRDVVEVLAFGEPLGIPLLADLTDSLAVEQAEARGLVEVYPDGRRLQARLAHPLYGEVQREQMGRLHARRLRGRIACALAATGERRAGDTLRRALLVMDSDLQPDPVLLTGAARRATELGDLALAERVARAAVAAGGEFEPRMLLGNALHWSGRAAETDTELAPLAALARTDAERAEATIPRVAALFFILGRPAEAEASGAPSPITPPPWSWRGCAQFLTPFLAGLSRPLTQPPRCLLIRNVPRPRRSWRRGVSPRPAESWAASTGLTRKCNGSTPVPIHSRLGCTRRPSSGRRGFGGCSWPVCWIRPSTPRDATASAARTSPEWEMRSPAPCARRWRSPADRSTARRGGSASPLPD